MATRRTTATPRPRRLLAALALLTAASTAISIGALPGLGVAEPRPTIEQVQHRIDVLNDQADRAVEAYAQARIALADARRTSAVSQGRVRREEAGLAAVRRAMSSVAASAYRSGGTDALVSLVSTSSPQAFLDRAASLDRIARDQAAQLAAMATARHQLLVVQDQANRDLARQKDAEAAVAGQKATIQRTLRAQKSLLASLQAEERARLARLQAERAATARRLATLARASRLRELVAASTDGSSSGALYNGPASGRAGAAVSEAYNKLGSPYEWGAAGPSRFDCSGLTMWAWARGGVSLPHSSQAQYDSIQHVAQSDVQPGDLVFFGSPIHHVGIYIGGGRMISAPHTGDVVKIQDAFRSDFVGAGRP
ncbi:MAG: peptidoglycan DL-endopeptidase CwlO [Actinomycetota bacterium]|nr:peptidoglycan DL-endopeptidase CwlO [Actinomycetota bacterium]